ncbi:MAG: hypothetical protein HYX63_01700 [Gammaproteobacteria bacterium]|nr:hypothetical protein [Gammaproteobacteria bacterium]
MSIRKARDVVRQLSELGLIDVRQSPGRITNEYKVKFGSNPAQRAELKRTQPGTVCRVKRTQPGTTGISTRHHTSRNPAQRAAKQDQERIKNKGAPLAPPTLWDVWAGIAGESNRPFLGKQIGQYGEDKVAAAVAIVATKKPADPMQYLCGILRKDRPAEVCRVAADY